MTSLTDLREVVDVIIGVDTHVHTHSAAAGSAKLSDYDRTLRVGGGGPRWRVFVGGTHVAHRHNQHESTLRSQAHRSEEVGYTQ